MMSQCSISVVNTNPRACVVSAAKVYGCEPCIASAVKVNAQGCKYKRSLNLNEAVQELDGWSSEQWQSTNIVVEICCSVDSALGRLENMFEGTLLSRACRSNDFSKTATVGLVLRCNKTNRCHVLYSSPCIGGCSFNMGINRSEGGVALQKKLDWYWIVHWQMWRGFKRIACKAASVGATLTLEWSHRCCYHRLAESRKLFDQYNMVYRPVAGCAVGLASIESATLGQPLCKSWGFWTNHPPVATMLQGPEVECNKSHPIVPTTGKNTSHSGNYTNCLAKSLHRAFRAKLEHAVHLHK